ncbi:hypothetical protein IWQ60_011017 [Tieghemiomyces parasiticus]|uniref:RING-type domain-containing protein n=1 Tax=Tieghemiomyces parasiticus TaxID=78921 RepID=A0A9W7ZI56_9FUNG|nr:hypothetical protein IWQ60_011017 [Tieghemiomyces parasiticus]
MAEQTSSSPNGSPSTSRVLRNQAAASPSSKRRSTTVADKATPPARTCKTRATASAGPSLMTTTTSTAFTLRHPLHVQIDASTLDQLPNITCVVCLGAPDPAATVACGHVFCEPCVLQLFQASNPPHHCPTCRQRFNRRQVRILQFPVAQVTMMTAAAHGDAKVGVANPLARGNAGANSVGKKDVPKEGDGSEDNTAESSSHRKRRRGLSTTQTTVVSTTTGTGTTPLRSSRSIATAHPDGGPNRQTVIDLDRRGLI